MDLLRFFGVLVLPEKSLRRRKRRVQGSGIWAEDTWGLGFQGLGFGFQGSGFRV